MPQVPAGILQDTPALIGVREVGQNFQALLECTRQVKKLEAKVAELEKQAQEPKPEIQRFTMPASQLSEELAELDIVTLYGRLDSEYYYTNHEGWGQAIDWVYVNCEMPEYFVDAEGQWNLDCEDFAIWLKAMISVHFGLNCVSITIGDIARGRHGFNMMRDEDEQICFEPNPGFGIDEPFSVKDNKYGYKPLYNFE